MNQLQEQKDQLDHFESNDNSPVHEHESDTDVQALEEEEDLEKQLSE